MDHPIPLQELPPQLQKFCDPSGPPPGRMMAAKGLVPLGPGDLATVLYQLSYDPDDGIKATAAEKASGLPENILQGALAGGLDVRVLDFFAGRVSKSEPLLQTIVLNHATAGETVARIAKFSSERLSEVIATNEQRLLAFPKIIESLYKNKHARMSTVNRAIELAVRNDIVLDGIAAFREAAAAIKDELIVDEVGPTPADEAFSQTLALSEELEREVGHEELEEDLQELRGLNEKKKLVHHRVAEMSATEKIRAAQIGEAVMRPYLIRDTNKLVAMAAIKSPALRETEVVAYCRNKNLPEEVIRYIANNKSWTKMYTVKYNLVENPKTPLPKALNFLPHLRQHDMKNVARSKSVPAAVAQAARNQLRKRQGR